MPYKHEGGLRTGGVRKKSAPEKPLISVITVVRDGEMCIEKTILSVLNQDYDNIEFIIIDGGSKDRTLDIIRMHEGFLDYWISGPDRGIYDAMNKGASLASGDWIIFLNADDVFYGKNLSLVADRLKDRNTVYYGNSLWPDSGRVYDGEFSGYKLMFKNICHQSIFYPGTVFTRYAFDVRYPVLADYHLNIRCYADKDLKFEYLPLIVSTFNDRQGASKSHRDDFPNDIRTVIKEHYPRRQYYAYLARRSAVELADMLGLRDTLARVLSLLGLKKYFMY
jgi:glycosyltransferase involved in cell wall biosynthesis